MPNYMSVNITSEVRSTPEELKYITLSWKDSLIKTFSTRAAWLATALLSLLTIIPLSGKLLLNIIDSFFHPESLKEVLKNALGILAAPFIAVITASLIFLPAAISGRLARMVVLPIIPLYSLGKTASHQHTIPEKNVSKVTGIKGIEIDSADIPYESKNQKVKSYRLVFNAAGEIYQSTINTITFLNNQLQCNSRLFNYPGITRNNPPGPSIDFVNAGIAEVYDIAEKMNWSNAELVKYLHLYGYCFGGAVALHVAAYFKEKHDVNLLIFVDRSYTAYSDAMAGLIHGTIGMPFLLAKAFSSTFLYAGGDLDLDSMAAIKKLNPKYIYPINVASHDIPEESRSEQMRDFLGLGPANFGEDSILLNKVALSAGLAEQKIQCGQCTGDIFRQLDIDHQVYALNERGHFENISMLQINLQQESELTAVDYYKAVVTTHMQNEEPRCVMR